MEEPEFDDAILGIVERCAQHPFVIYDREKCLDILVSLGCSPDDAVEFFEYNIVGSWVGDYTPGFLSKAGEET